MTTHSTASSLNLPAGKTILDAVMYAATLVSKTSDIDPLLDRVRAITAQRSANQLTKEDTENLQEVYNYIEAYLVDEEALRSFTRESVRTKVYEYLRGSKQSTLIRPLVVIWTIAITGALGALVVPETMSSPTVKVTLAMTFFLATVHLGAVWMFWTGLANFKDHIRRAYLPICVGIALVGVMLLQVPVAVAAGQDSTVWFRYGSSELALPIAEVLFYVGMRRFAKIGGVKSRLLSVWLVLGLCIALSLVVVLLPRPSDLPVWIVNASLATLTTGAVLSAVTALITASVRRSLSAAYKEPMLWFMVTLLVSTYSCVQYAILQMFATIEHPYNPAGLAILPLFISAFVILKAGTSFRKIGTSDVQRQQTNSSQGE